MNSPNIDPSLNTRVKVLGELQERLGLNFDRLERDDYKPSKEYINPDWQGIL
jgi:hypothetical protein